MKTCSHEIIQNKEEKWKHMSLVRSKSQNTSVLHAATPQDPTDTISLMKFCVVGMLVHVLKTIHGDFGAMNPMRLNCRPKSYLGSY